MPKDEHSSMLKAANNVENYTELSDFKEDRLGTETLHKRAIVYLGTGGVLFIVFLSLAAGLYSFQPIRVANIAFSLAFMGLLLFVTLAGIAFLTIFDTGEINYKEVFSENSGGRRRKHLGN